MTTDAPPAIARSSRVRAGSMPPMTSMTMSAPSTSVSASSVRSARSIDGSRARRRPGRRCRPARALRPTRAARSSDWSDSRRATWVPTTPQPRSATRSADGAGTVATLQVARSVRLGTLGCSRTGRSWSSWWDEVELVVLGREGRTTDCRRGCSSGGRPQDTRSVEAGEPPVRRRAGRASRGRAVDDHGSGAQARRARRSISDRCLDPRRWRCRRLAPRRSAGLRGHRSWTPAPRGHGSCGCRARPGP